MTVEIIRGIFLIAIAEHLAQKKKYQHRYNNYKKPLKGKQILDRL